MTRDINLVPAGVEPGYELPETTVLVAYDMIAGLVSATRDWFPGHHDPQYALAQGKKTIYANTMFFQGMFDRAVLGWSGPGWFVHKRSVTMRQSLYPGDTLVVRSTVTAVLLEESGRAILELDVVGGSPAEEVYALGRVAIALPVRRDVLTDIAQ